MSASQSDGAQHNYGDTTDFECQGGPSAPLQDRCSPMPEWRTIFPVYLASLSLPVDDALVLPSLWEYIQDLNGSAQWYGGAQACYYSSRAIALPSIGLLIDRTSFTYSCIFFWTLVLGVVASILYTAAPILGGLPMVLVSRALLGISSSASVASLAYIADHVPTVHRTKAFSLSFGLQRGCVPIAPALNLLLVNLPDGHLGPLALNKYTYVGLATAALNGLILTSLVLLREPPKKRDNSSPAPSPSEVCRTLGRTRAYISFFLSFQNNWTNQVVLWTMPLITSRLYPGLGIVGNSTLLASGGIVALLTVCTTPMLLKGVPDRLILLVTQLWQSSTIIPFAWLYGCDNSISPPLWCYYLLYDVYSMAFIAQMPANNAIYTKLIGAQTQGIYLSLLELSKAAARIIAGYLIGVTYVALGPCVLWTLTLGILALQFVPFLANWSHLGV